MIIYINLGIKNFYWQAGYGVHSLSAKGIPFVVRYIVKQKLKHAKGDLVDVLENMPKDEEPKKSLSV